MKQAAFGNEEDQRMASAQSSSIYPTKVRWSAIGVFVALAMLLAWAAQLPVWLSGQGLNSPLFGVTTAAMQVTPALAALIVMLIWRQPNKRRLLGLSPLRPLKRTLGFALVALLGTPILVFIAMLLGQALGLIRLDFATFSGLAASIQSSGQSLPGGSMLPLVMLQLLFLPVMAIAASVTGLGEELGWRGWLLPHLLPLGTWQALSLTGLIWGVWHSPMILLGYNYDRPDLVGVGLMTIWCVLVGILIGWLRLRSASIWPAAIAHGSLNAAAISMLLTFRASGQGQEVINGTIIGWAGWIVLAAAILVLGLTGQLTKYPAPAAAPNQRDSTPLSP